MTKFPPREGDLPVAELINRANDQIAHDLALGIRTNIHFKFTCEHCGERCTFDEPNAMYDYGECHKCGKQTKITVGGYMMTQRL